MVLNRNQCQYITGVACDTLCYIIISIFFYYGHPASQFLERSGLSASCADLENFTKLFLMM